MATINDLIEVTSISTHTTYSEANGTILGVVDGVTSTELDDGEFDEGDIIYIGGVPYSIDILQEPDSSGSFTLGDGSTTSFNPGAESNLDVIFMTVSNGGDVRHFVIPNDSYGDMNVHEIRTGEIGNVAGSDAATISTGDNAIKIVCFTKGTLIEGANTQQHPIEQLRIGDKIMTADRGLQAIKWIGITTIGASQMGAQPNLRPIRVAAGALGHGMPCADLVVSPQHRILVRSKIVQRMFGQNEVLIAAKHLIEVDGIDMVENLVKTKYYHVLTDHHEVVFANGAAAETLYLGDQTLKAIGQQARDEILQLFPDVADWGRALASSRPLVTGRRGRALALRHQKNHAALVSLSLVGLSGAWGGRGRPAATQSYA